MVNVLGQFIPNQSQITSPLRSLLRKDNKAVSKIMVMLSFQPVVLQFVNINDPVVLQLRCFLSPSRCLPITMRIEEFKGFRKSLIWRIEEFKGFRESLISRMETSSVFKFRMEKIAKSRNFPLAKISS